MSRQSIALVALGSHRSRTPRLLKPVLMAQSCCAAPPLYRSRTRCCATRSRRLADVQPDLRRASLQPPRRDIATMSAHRSARGPSRCRPASSRSFRSCTAASCTSRHPAAATAAAASSRWNAATGETLWEYVPPTRRRRASKPGYLRRHDLLHGAGAERRAEPRSRSTPPRAPCAGKHRHSRDAHGRRHRRGGQGDLGPRLQHGALELLHRGARCAHRKEAWRFYTSPEAGEPGDESWGGKAVDERRAAAWGLPGTYDPVRRLVYWGIANPMPNTRVRPARRQRRCDPRAMHQPISTATRP